MIAKIRPYALVGEGEELIARRCALHAARPRTSRQNLLVAFFVVAFLGTPAYGAPAACMDAASFAR